MNYCLNREDSLLLLIDIQEKLSPVMEARQELMEASNKLIRASNILGLPIIVTEQYPKGLGKTDGDLEGLEGADFYSKTSFTALTDQVLLRLKELSRKQIIVIGIESHICVFQTVRDLSNLGYEIYIPREAVASRTQANYQNGLELMKAVGGLVTNLETVLFDLVKDARDKDFKEISNLIK